MDSAVSCTQLAGLGPDPGRVFGSSVLEWVATQIVIYNIYSI